MLLPVLLKAALPEIAVSVIHNFDMKVTLKMMQLFVWMAVYCDGIVCEKKVEIPQNERTL